MIKPFLKKRLPASAIDRIRLTRNALRLLCWQLRPPVSNEPVPLSQPDRQFDALFQNSRGQFEAILQPFVGECRWPLPEVYNGFFEAVDAEFYYCIIRSRQPRTIIEIGSGWATRFAWRALARNGGGKIICIDPEPRRLLPPQVSHIRSKVEEADLSVFDQLCAGDILFIDSSHTRQEAEYHARHILKRLKPGVLVHHHDIMYPYRRCFDEEAIVLDFYHRHQASFEVLTGLAFVRYACPDLCLSLVPSFRRAVTRVPGSLWTRRIAQCASSS